MITPVIVKTFVKVERGVSKESVCQPDTGIYLNQNLASSSIIWAMIVSMTFLHCFLK